MSKEVIIKGARFRVLLNGRKSINGKPYGVEMTGEFTEQDGGENLFDAMDALVENLRTEMADMQLPQSIRVTIITPTELELLERTGA